MPTRESASFSASTRLSSFEFHNTNRNNACITRGTSQLFMAADDEGPGLLASIGIGLFIILFAVTGLMPTFEGGGDRDLSIADSVVTKQDLPGKLQNFESKQDSLSRATIQEKLSAIPIFYLSEGDSMKTDIYLSYNDAIEAAGEGVTVKATSLDQVMYVSCENCNPPLSSSRLNTHVKIITLVCFF